MPNLLSRTSGNTFIDYPVCAESSLVIDHAYHDFEMQSERLNGYDQRYFQLSSGQFEGRFLTAALGSKISFHFEFANQQLQQFVGFPSEVVSLGLVFSNEKAFRVNGISMGTDDVMICRPGGEMNMVSPSMGAVLAICIPKSELENTAAGVNLLRLTEKMPGSIGIYQQPRLAHRLREDALTAIEGLRGVSGNIDSHQMESIGHAAVDCILGQLGLYFSPASMPQLKSVSSMYETCRKVHDTLMGSNDLALDYINLSSATGLSRRSLQMAFSRYLDMTPTQYSRVLRLNMARRMLVHGLTQAETIGEVAQNNGFFGWSRFTQHYTDLFGELPSQTKERYSN